MLHKEICIASNRHEELEFCYSRLQSLNTKVDFFEGKHFTRFAVNVDDGLMLSVKELVADVVGVIRKFEYIMTKLEMKECSLCLCSLVSALIYFENIAERSRIIKLISQADNYNIDGIFDFCIGDLKSDWDELIELTNSLLASGYSDIDVYNVASFMISPRIKAEKSIFIADIESALITNVSRGGVVEVIDLYHNDEFNLINAIIAESPSELIVEGEDINNKVVQTLKNLVKIKVI